MLKMRAAYPGEGPLLGLRLLMVSSRGGRAEKLWVSHKITNPLHEDSVFVT